MVALGPRAIPATSAERAASRQLHADDHTELHRLHDILDALDVPAQVAVLLAADALLDGRLAAIEALGPLASASDVSDAVAALTAALAADQAGLDALVAADSALDARLDAVEPTVAALSSTYQPLLTQVVVTATHTAAPNTYILATCATAYTETLPATPPAGTVVRIKLVTGQPITVLPQGADTIDGNANHIIYSQNMDISFRFDGDVWRTGPAYLPFVYLKYQIATAEGPAGGSSNFCLVVPNQITTGSANDGVHDMVFVVGNNPAIGDADFLFTRGADNAVGVMFLHVPLKFSTGFDFIVQDNANVPRLRWSQSTGNLTLSGGSMVFNSLYGLTFSMASGSAAQVSSDSSSRLNISGGSGGIRFLNNAFSAINLTLSDAGDLTLGGHLNMTAGKFLTIGGAACLQYDGSSRLNIAGGAGGTRFLNAAFSVANATLSDLGDFSLGRTAPATTATTGFPFIPVMAGTPTGVPTGVAGFVPIVADSSGSKLWCYIGGAWKGVVVA